MQFVVALHLCTLVNGHLSIFICASHVAVVLLHMDTAEPFSHRPRPMLCLFAQMGPCHIRPLWLQSLADIESHCWHVPFDEVQRQTHELHEADDDAANWLINIMTTTFARWKWTRAMVALVSLYFGPLIVFVCASHVAVVWLHQARPGQAHICVPLSHHCLQSSYQMHMLDCLYQYAVFPADIRFVLQVPIVFLCHQSSDQLSVVVLSRLLTWNALL